MNAAWVEKQRPETEQESIKRRKIGCAAPAQKEIKIGENGQPKTDSSQPQEAKIKAI